MSILKKLKFSTRKGMAICSFAIAVLVGMGAGQITTTYLSGKQEHRKVYSFASTHTRSTTETSSAVFIDTKKHAVRNISEFGGFSKIIGSSIGIVNSFNYKGYGRYSERDGVVANDFDKDGWVDIAMLSEGGVVIFFNQDGISFSKTEIPVRDTCGSPPSFIASADITNDGWIDIFVNVGCGENLFLVNNEGGFTNTNYLPATLTSGTISSMTFADVDKNGLLDWFVSVLVSDNSDPAVPKNKIILNDGEGVFHLARTTGGSTAPGTIVSPVSLFSDIDGDHNIDLIVGNDYITPDYFYKNTGDSLQEIFRQDNYIPVSSLASMSIDSADINNDSYLDIYIAGGSSTSTHQKYYADVENYCEGLDSPDTKQCIRGYTYDLQEKERARSTFMHDPREGTIHQKSDGNVLLLQQDGDFRDKATFWEVENVGWSWNSRFADLDNDEWQDLYVTNGRINNERENTQWRQRNIVFKNISGKKFESANEEFNIDSDHVVFSYVYFDFDNDGDVDILEIPLFRPIVIHKNNEVQNNSITVSFVDLAGNHFGVGNKVVIHYGNNQLQVRELKSGGGYNSFDPYVLHFGLGLFKEISHYEIYWSTGEKTTHAGPFSANTHYTFTRK